MMWRTSNVVHVYNQTDHPYCDTSTFVSQCLVIRTGGLLDPPEGLWRKEKKMMTAGPCGPANILFIIILLYTRPQHIHLNIIIAISGTENSISVSTSVSIRLPKRIRSHFLLMCFCLTFRMIITIIFSIV